MTKRRRLFGGLAVFSLILSLAPLMALPAAAVSAPEVVATGLDAPYKLTQASNGDWYVAEAGRGGSTCYSATSPDGAEVEACVGATGAVSVISDGEVSEAVGGLPSLQLGMEPIGPTAVDFTSSGVMHVTVGLGGDLDTRAATGDDRFGTLLRVVGDDVAIVGDLAAFEESDDPDAGQPGVEGPDSNPFGLAFDGGDALVADAGGNSLLRVTSDGTVTLEAVFAPTFVDPPPFIPAPGQIPMQSVPTTVEVDSGGQIFVGQLTGFPFQAGAANIFTVDGGTATAAVTGFTNIIDMAIADDGTIYVLEFASNSLLAPAPAPALVQVRTDGTRKTLLYGDELPVPGGVAVGADGMVYLSVCTLCGPGEGMVWRVDPSVASDAATASACDPEAVPGGGFGDIAPSLHREAIDCVAWWDVVNGFSPTTFGPDAPVTREQVAAIIARALRSAGVVLVTGAPDAFTDDDGSFAEADIDVLAQAGVISGRGGGLFDPGADVSRAELASLLARASALAGVELAAGPDTFTDDTGSVHEADINAVAGAGWVNGVGGGLFDPTGDATRGQLASMVARMLSTLVDEGVATLPG